MKIELLGRPAAIDGAPGACFVYTTNGRQHIAIRAERRVGNLPEKCFVRLTQSASTMFNEPWPALKNYSTVNGGAVFELTGAQLVPSRSLVDIKPGRLEEHYRAGLVVQRGEDLFMLARSNQMEGDVTGINVKTGELGDILAPGDAEKTTWFTGWSVVVPQFERMVEILRFPYPDEPVAT